MALALVKGEVAEPDCSVCHEAFKEPKILPCGHVVSRHCLLSWIRAQPQANCPLCRCTVLEMEGQPESMEEEVGALPTDLALAELVEARALLDKDHTCCVCEDVAATALCLDCGDMLCASCRKAHEKMKVSKHHKVEDLSSLTPDALAASRPSPCSSHPDEQCKLFCPTHGMSLCVLCATAKHRSCPGLQDLEEKTEEARAALVQMAASLTATESELEEAIQGLDRHIKDTDERVQATISHIQKMCDQLEACVNSCRSDLTDLACSTGSNVKEKAQAAITILQAKKCRVTSHSVVVTRAGGSKVEATVREMSAVMATRMQELHSEVTLPASDALTPMIFPIDDGVVSTVEKALAKLCRVHQVPTNRLASATRSEAGAKRSRAKSANRGGAGAGQKNEGVAAKGIPPLLSLPGVAHAAKFTPDVKGSLDVKGSPEVKGSPVVKGSPDVKVAKGGKGAKKRQAGEFSFHTECGAMIELSVNQRTAIRQEGAGSGLVASSKRLETNVLYEVRLDQWRTGGWLAVGAITIPPTIDIMVGGSGHLLPVTAVSKKGVKANRIKDYSDHPLSSVMKGLREGERVGVRLDSSHCIHLHVNGQDRGVWDTPVTGPCHALIELGTGSCGKVTALPPTRMDG